MRGLPPAVLLSKWPERQQPSRSGSFLQVSHVDTGAQGRGPFSAALPGHQRERNQSGVARTRTDAYLGCQHCRQWTYPLHHRGGPSNYPYKDSQGIQSRIVPGMEICFQLLHCHIASTQPLQPHCKPVTEK